MVTHIGTRTITTSDCLFVRNENGRVVLFASTYNRLNTDCTLVGTKK